MIDPKLLREEPDRVRKYLKQRNSKLDLDAILKADADRRTLQVMVDSLRAEKNLKAGEFGKMKKAGTGDGPDGKALMEAMQAVDAKQKGLEATLAATEARAQELLLQIPNVPHESVPVGASSADNVRVRTWGTPRAFDFKPKTHWELGEALGLIDLERATKIAGASFPLFLGAGARLMRAITQYMLDLHTGKHGYTEVNPPLMTLSPAMVAGGQLPSKGDDMYHVPAPDDLWLIPTGEVPLLNIHREEILDADRLPIRYVAYTPCFRKEAGAAGKDTRGLIRQHQFDKVEMFQYVKPEDSLAACEAMVMHAEAVLQGLGLPYQLMALCTADITTASHKTYDPEVWLPGQNEWREIASVSTCSDYQARRAQIRFRRDKQAKPELVHTLNGSGLAVGRTFVAVLENYQEADGSVTVPAALHPYMGGLKTITRG